MIAVHKNKITVLNFKKITFKFKKKKQKKKTYGPPADYLVGELLLCSHSPDDVPPRTSAEHIHSRGTLVILVWDTLHWPVLQSYQVSFLTVGELSSGNKILMNAQPLLFFFEITRVFCRKAWFKKIWKLLSNILVIRHSAVIKIISNMIMGHVHTNTHKNVNNTSILFYYNSNVITIIYLQNIHCFYHKKIYTAFTEFYIHDFPWQKWTH